MNKVSILAFSLAAILTAPRAEYFTFLGTINSINYPNLNMNHVIGSEVSYIFYADFSQDGYYLKTDGLAYVIPVAQGGFYSEIIKGSGLVPTFGQQYDPTENYGIVEGHLGSTSRYNGGIQYDFNARHNGHHINIYSYLSYTSNGFEYQPGIFGGSEESYDPNGNRYTLTSKLKLASITKENPVIPEPSSIAFFGFGIVVLSIIAIRNRGQTTST
jgi:hypothetical protein